MNLDGLRLVTIVVVLLQLAFVIAVGGGVLWLILWWAAS